jgi:hypothetical protein
MSEKRGFRATVASVLAIALLLLSPAIGVKAQAPTGWLYTTVPGGAAGGDLSGTYPSPGVAKVNGYTPGGTCSSQVVTAIDSSGRPTCTTLTTAYGSATAGGTAGGDLSGTYPNPAVNQVTGILASYNGVATVSDGIPHLVAKIDLAAQAANISATTLYAVPAGGGGLYRISCYTVVTQAATSSSTLAQCYFPFYDKDTNVATNTAGITGAVTSNTVGLTQGTGTGTYTAGTTVINARASTNIQYGTVNYASSGATAMQYAIHIRVEYLGY